MITTEQPISFHEFLKIEEELFHKEFNATPDFTAVAPGRINIIGEHTDYNNGLSVPAAINRWVLISFKRRQDTRVHIKSLNYNSELIFALGNIPSINESWQKYIYGAVDIIKSQTDLRYGFEALIWGNVPEGSGISSSAALEVAMMNGLRSLYEVNFDDLHLVKLCQKVEHEHLNLKSGLLDQYASQFSRQGKIMVLDLASLTHQYVEVNMKDLEWVLVDSGVRRELAHSGYPQRVKETNEAFHFIQEKDTGIRSMRDLKEEHIGILPNEILQKRIRHYLSENQRVIFAMDAIQHQDYQTLGNILNSSHQSLSKDYEVSCNELDFLAMTAQRFEGCLGSRIMGGGFGGCTLNLVYKDKFSEFSTHIKQLYRDRCKSDALIDNFSLVEGASIHWYR